MSKYKKLHEKLRQSQKNVRFDDLANLVQAFGMVCERQEGSHKVYKHPSIPGAFLNLQEDKNGQAKPYQVKQALTIINQFNLSLNSEEETNKSADGES